MQRGRYRKNPHFTTSAESGLSDTGNVGILANTLPRRSASKPYFPPQKTRSENIAANPIGTAAKTQQTLNFRRYGLHPVPRRNPIKTTQNNSQPNTVFFKLLHAGIRCRTAGKTKNGNAYFSYPPQRKQRTGGRKYLTVQSKGGRNAIFPCRPMNGNTIKSRRIPFSGSPTA